MPPRRAPLTVVVLAAGQGTRMRSKIVKVLHPVAGRPMAAHVLEAAGALNPSAMITVVGHQEDRVREALADAGCSFALQREQLGTGHAVLQAARKIQRSPGATLLILSGDVPTLRASTLRRLVARHRKSGAALTVLTAEIPDPTGYGRIVREGEIVTRIVEHRDANATLRKIREINSGIYCADASLLLSTLKRLRPDNAQGEYYLTDAVHELIAKGKKVLAVRHADTREVLGVNNREELARASIELHDRKALELQSRGVTILDVARTRIDPRARIGRDSTIYPDVIVEGATRIGEDCVVGPGSRIVDCTIGNAVEIRDHSVLIDSRIGNGAQIGPFAHLRPGSVLERDVRVGNFVELKKTRLGAGTKASHLSYLGDATIGPGCNIGAGTITCNYDGTHKHPTVLGPGVFVGSDAQLVAPVTVRKEAYIAAGTTVTMDVPSGALAIGRARQRNLVGWVARKKQS